MPSASTNCTSTSSSSISSSSSSSQKHHPTSTPTTYFPLHPPPNYHSHPSMKPLGPPSPPPSDQRHIQEGRPRQLLWRKSSLLRPHRRTNPLIWCSAFLCILFFLLLIVAGILTLVMFLVIKPKHPVFDTTAASLNAVYLDSPRFLNCDLTVLANFSNPNRHLDLMFEYVQIELYFSDRLVATRTLEPFAQRRGETRLEAVHMVGSEVLLPAELGLEMEKQVTTNAVFYNLRGTFRVRASLGFGHYPYWLYGRCLMELTGPPNGVLVGKNCRTKR